MTTKRFSLALVLAGIITAMPAAYAAGPGGGPHVKTSGGNTGPAATKDDKHKDIIEIDSFAAGTTQPKGKTLELGSLKAGATEPTNNPKSGAPGNLKGQSTTQPGLLLPAVQKARDDGQQQKKNPTYPGPGVETWQGKRFPPPAPTQPALKSGADK